VLDLLISGGHVVTPDAEGPMDVGVAGEKIVAVAATGALDGLAEEARRIDATGMLVLPGGVEAHAHIAEPAHRGWTRGEEVWLQSPEGATRAAAFGGTTTVASFAFMGVHARDERHPSRAVEDRRALFAGRSYVDYTFHPALVGNIEPAVVAALGEAVADGIPTFKAFTTCVTSAQHGVKMDNGPLLDTLRRLAQVGGLLLVHAEDDELVTSTEARLRAEGRDQWFNLHLVHSDLSEELAFRRVETLAREAGAAVYFVHVTSRRGVEIIAGARQAGRPVYGEVLHNYLCFTADDYRLPDGMKIQTYPALKSADDQAALWEGLGAPSGRSASDGPGPGLEGAISVVATDEYTTSYAVKTAGRTVETACGGHAGIETRGMIAYSEGVASGRLTLRRFVEVIASNPARLLGLYPRKGAIAPGSDADIAIWNPAVERTIRLEDLHHDADYSIWEGRQVRGWPVTTISRGRIVTSEGRLLGTPDHGTWLARQLAPEVLRGPGV
jgi:dihydropyrimidinase